jgi:trk system potassium uptake protein TrkH
MLFIIIYLIVFVAGTFFMSFLGVDFQTSVGSVITTMGGIGPGIGSVGPAGNFSAIPDTGKILLSMLMIMGRLEILTFLIVFTPSFWKN